MISFHQVHINDVKVVDRVIAIFVNLRSESGNIYGSARLQAIPQGYRAFDSKAVTKFNVWLEISVWEVEDEIEMDFVSKKVALTIVTINIVVLKIKFGTVGVRRVKIVDLSIVS